MVTQTGYLKRDSKNCSETLTMKLCGYEQILFYYNPGRFHQLYRRLLEETRLKNKINMITHLNDIV